MSETTANVDEIEENITKTEITEITTNANEEVCNASEQLQNQAINSPGKLSEDTYEIQNVSSKNLERNEDQEKYTAETVVTEDLECEDVDKKENPTEIVQEVKESQNTNTTPTNSNQTKDESNKNTDETKSIVEGIETENDNKTEKENNGTDPKEEEQEKVQIDESFEKSAIDSEITSQIQESSNLKEDSSDANKSGVDKKPEANVSKQLEIESCTDQPLDDTKDEPKCLESTKEQLEKVPATETPDEIVSEKDQISFVGAQECKENPDLQTISENEPTHDVEQDVIEDNSTNISSEKDQHITEIKPKEQSEEDQEKPLVALENQLISAIGAKQNVEESSLETKKEETAKSVEKQSSADLEKDESSASVTENSDLSSKEVEADKEEGENSQVDLENTKNLTSTANALDVSSEKDKAAEKLNATSDLKETDSAASSVLEKEIDTTVEVLKASSEKETTIENMLVKEVEKIGKMEQSNSEKEAVISATKESVSETSFEKVKDSEEAIKDKLEKPVKENKVEEIEEAVEELMQTVKESEEKSSKIVSENVEDKSKTTTTKSIDEITAVIEIDDDNDDNEEKKAEKPTKEDSEEITVEKDEKHSEENKPTSKDDTTAKETASGNDVIEIDDDDDDEANKLKIDENIEEPSELENKTVEEESTKLVETESKMETESGIDTIAKMHTMPMIFYNKECINFECPKTHKEFHRAPQFALNYFKISKKKMKVQYICGDCYDLTLAFYQDFCGVLDAKQPILMRCIANKKQEFVEILDSSDEDDDGTTDLENKEKEYSSFSQADLDLIEAEFDNTLRKVFDRVEIQNQLTWTKTIFTERVKKLQNELEYIDSELSETQKIADRMYNDLYNSGKYRINTLKPLDLDNDIEQIPPLGEIERPSVKVGTRYYAARNKAIACWVPCHIIEQVESFLFVPHYRVKFLNTQFQTYKNLSAKLIAYFEPPAVRLSVGQRVIAYFDGTTLSSNDKEKNQVKSAFYPGIIAEEMKPNNFYRYLIFYDDGYTQYVSHKDVRLVCNVARNVWEDVDHVSREFIKKYVQEYRVNRPMVQTHKGQKMATEKNGRWVPARVIDIDCSLVRMQFEGPKGNHTEWIYRGSLRLNPVYMEYQKSKSNQVAKRTAVSRLPRRTEPFIRYTEDEEHINAQQQEQQQDASRTLTRSNSNSASTTPTVRHLNANTIYLEDENKPKGKVIYYTAKRQMPTRVYRPHDCGPHCLIVIPHNLNGYSPLAKPLLSGWERLFSRQKIKKTVYYRAPCGKMFRNMKELHSYIRLTKCPLNVDNFDFYAETSCLAEFEAENVMLKKRDISEGQEKIPLPLINYYDESLPECTYAAKVIPTEGVNINKDLNFLICCDCEDDCVDKSKCACWQLTVEGVKTTNPEAITDDIGYQYKRLYDHLPTGIYECNPRCKCKSNCLNRVVQHGLGMKLQVFKTSNRGWGLRCLNDIPRGSFVCVYAGNLLTEAKANEGGQDAGDEYFAELDYIETVEQLKEGYESDVENAEDDDDEENYEPEAADDLDFRPSRSTERRVKRGTSSGGARSEGERQAINFNPNMTIEHETKKKRVSVRTLFGKDEAVYVMDAKVTGNLGRYFNHSCSPNLFVQNVFVDTHDLRFPWVAFFASTHIRAGTELTWNYNYEVGVVPGKVLYCQCGAANCRQRLL